METDKQNLCVFLEAEEKPCWDNQTRGQWMFQCGGGSGQQREEKGESWGLQRPSDPCDLVLFTGALDKQGLGLLDAEL